VPNIRIQPGAPLSGFQHLLKPFFVACGAICWAIAKKHISNVRQKIAITL